MTKVYIRIKDEIMEKQLNMKQINSAMERHGLNQAALSKELGVSRAIVSAWFKGQKFPRPDKLLKLGLIFGLSFQELVSKSATLQEPVIAFRKKGARKTKDVHLNQAKEMGQLLELLVPYISNDRMFQPPALINPTLEYQYIQKAAKRVREEIGIRNGSPIKFEQLIGKVNEFEVILIPVFHGNKDNHENALHILLPSSNTTWIYLNLDTNIHDFKFWMAHELGHVLSPSLKGETAEDFADTFAQSLLFSEEQAESAYKVLMRLRSKKGRLNKIVEISQKLTISPITVYKAINNFAIEYDYAEILLEPDIFATAASLNKKYLNVSETLFKKKSINVSNYIEMTETVFNSKFFEMLKICLSENDKSAGFIQSILDTSILDAKEIHAELVK